MVSAELGTRTSDTIEALRSIGVSVVSKRELANGLQLRLASNGTFCTVNLYYSKANGFSVIPSGGDRQLLDAVVSLTSDTRKTPDGNWIGTDEAGKGDYLGPLVVCAVHCSSETAEQLVNSGAADSKTLTDSAIRRIAASCMELLNNASATISISPSAYNKKFTELRRCGMNSLDLLAEAHGKAIGVLIDRGYTPDRIVIDRFCGRKRLDPFLPSTDARLELRPRAEDDPAVAAASVIARFRYVEALSEMSKRYGVELTPGAGRSVDAAATILTEMYGPQVLEKTAKIHFRNTLRLISPDLTEA